jgi:hypothetical protein
VVGVLCGEQRLDAGAAAEVEDGPDRPPVGQLRKQHRRRV